MFICSVTWKRVSGKLFLILFICFLWCDACIIQKLANQPSTWTSLAVAWINHIEIKVCCKQHNKSYCIAMWQLLRRYLKRSYLNKSDYICKQQIVCIGQTRASFFTALLFYTSLPGEIRSY